MQNLPTERKTGGALLGDRIRMNTIPNPRAYMRSLATRGAKGELSAATVDAIRLCRLAGFDWIVVETSGTGQGDTEIVDLCDVSVYVMTPEFGAPTQLEKVGMLDFADVVRFPPHKTAGIGRSTSAERRVIEPAGEVREGSIQHAGGRADHQYTAFSQDFCPG